MTGLDLAKDALIEIAALVTDADLNVLGDGLDLVIHAGDDVLASMPDVVREMPALDAHLHYRMVDVSSIKELVRRWYPRIYYAKPEKGLAHRALADIKESIRELEYYRRTLFVPPPGPTSEEAQAVAAQLP